MMNLKEVYDQRIRPQLQKDLQLSNINAVPRIEKITINMGVGEAITNKKTLEHAVAELQLIAGQKPIMTMAKKSVASFKLREGWAIGCKSTLRGKRMYDFLFRLVHIALPRVRDFRGLSLRSFDGRGGYNMGVKEQIIFPEIDYDKVDSLRGMDISITTSTMSDDHAKALLKSFDFPFVNPQQ